MNPFTSSSFKILHISDLHIPESSIKDGKIKYPLWEKLWGLAQGRFEGRRVNEYVDFCVITGDLASTSPDKRIYSQIKKEMNELFPPKAKGEAPRWAVVPGNHDRKKWGNFLLDQRIFDDAFEDWNNPRWFKSAPVFILPLDSNPKPGHRVKMAFDLARGLMGNELSRIGDECKLVQGQMIDWCKEVLSYILDENRDKFFYIFKRFRCLFPHDILANFFNDEIMKIEENTLAILSQMLGKLLFARAAKIILIHHHPIGVAHTENLGITAQDAFLAMVDAGDFLRKARENGFSLVCHGHKHRPHRIGLGLPGSDDEYLGIVGCGSTTKEGAGDHASANIVNISEAGEVSVELIMIRGESWEGPAHKLNLRLGSVIRRRLVEILAIDALYSVKDVYRHLMIYDRGDAILTIQFSEIRFKEKALVNNYVYLPITVETLTSIKSQQVNYQIDSGARENIGHVELIAVGESSPGKYNGFVKIEINDVENTALTLTIRFTLFSCFAMNEWQSRCLYGSEGYREGGEVIAGGLKITESISWYCFLPVRGSLIMELEIYRGSFYEPFVFQRNLDGISEPRDPAAEISRDPSLSRLRLRVNNPVCGSTYGIHWNWKKEADYYRLPFENEKVRQFLLSDPPQQQGLHKALMNIIRGLDSELEIALFLIKPGPEQYRGSLVQMCWNHRIEKESLTEITFGFGVGVAGKAAFNCEPVVWIPEVQQNEIAQLTDFFVPFEGRQYSGIFAIPLPVNSPHPLFVLSIATTDVDQAFASHLKVYRGAGEWPKELDWVRALQGDIEKEILKFPDS